MPALPLGTKFDELPPDVAKIMRENCAKGGKSGSHDDKVRAGRLGYEARIKKAMAQVAAAKKGASLAIPTNLTTFPTPKTTT